VFRPFGQAFGEVLKRSGMTQVEFAQAVGVNQGFLSKVLAVRRRPPIAQMTLWLDTLEIRGAEREYLLLLANLEHSPRWVAPFVQRLLDLLAENLQVETQALFGRLAESEHSYQAKPPPDPPRRTRQR